MKNNTKQDIQMNTVLPNKNGMLRTTNKDIKKYFVDNLKLSEEEKKKNSYTIIDFNINCNGEVCNIKTFIEKDTEFEKAIISLLRKMPNWQPAKMRGQTVNITMKFKFELKDGALKVNGK